MRYRIEEDRKRSLVGRLLLRFSCATHLKIPLEQVRFVRTPENKPICLDLQTTGQVNISHHGSFVVCALEPNVAQVGVDVMRFDRHADPDKLFYSFRHYFTPREWVEIGASTELFYERWSLKEALVKAMGIGLGFDLRRASFHVEGTPTFRTAQVEIDGLLAPEWKLELFSLDDTHCVSVALWVDGNETASRVPEFTLLAPGALLSNVL
jgi:4'-phosphopantetheinyl transferase